MYLLYLSGFSSTHAFILVVLHWNKILVNAKCKVASNACSRKSIVKPNGNVKNVSYLVGSVTTIKYTLL